MPLKIAFAGFRHSHIFSLYDLARTSDELEIVGACEDHEHTRAEIRDKGSGEITHNGVDEMLDDVDCDIVATGTYFARRGQVLINALERGKHVISDKPLCTAMDDLERIEELSREKGLKVGCMLTMRDSGQFIAVRDLIQSGRIGAVHAIAFGGQHPLLLGSRPGWYFEEGKHGGTITDIGVHAIDALPWITGLEWSKINAARCWNAFAPKYPHFEDAAQMMLEMKNGCGVIGDVSYFAPDRAGYRMPYYWRTTFWGRDGVIETATTSKEIQLLGKDDDEVQSLPLAPAQKGGHLRAFLTDIAGETPHNELDTTAVLSSA
ncbi:MAG: Gfo/Idh/MocA family oxidoreductase, partial [Candidatus Latescibacterota bacterium]|nr:Gfo/Idh/MocA family oxidoreductase [Candidatus Latescibacterota bacterium]